MYKNKQNKQLAEWLQSLGCPVQLSDNDLTKLNSINMRSVWRHLQAHTKTVQCIQMIKKNLLLSRLKKETNFPGKFGHFKIESIHELSQLQKMSVTQEQINSIQMKNEDINKNLQLLIPTYFKQVFEKKSMQLKLKECEEKTAFLKLKLFCINKNIDSITKEIETANCLKTYHPTVSLPELNRMKSIVCNYASKYDGLTPEVIVATEVYPISVISDGIYLASKNAFKSLNAFKTNLDVSADVQKIEQKLAAKGFQTFSEHLKNLNILVVENEINIHNYVDKIEQYLSELDREKIALVNALEEMYLQHGITSESDIGHISCVQFVNNLENNVRVIKKIEKTKYLVEELSVNCSDFDNRKFYIDTVKEREIELRKKLDNKVDGLNNLITQISNCSMTKTKAEALQKCCEGTSVFFNDLKLNAEREEDIVSKLDYLIQKEIEVFQKEPVVAVLRNWDEIAQKQSVQNRIPEDNLLIYLLCHSEPKNILKSILEKIVWSLIRR